MDASPSISAQRSLVGHLIAASVVVGPVAVTLLFGLADWSLLGGVLAALLALLLGGVWYARTRAKISIVLAVVMAVAIPVSSSAFLVSSLNVLLERYEPVALDALPDQPDTSRVRVEGAVVDASRTAFHDYTQPSRGLTDYRTVAALRAPGADADAPVVAVLSCRGDGDQCAKVWQRSPIVGVTRTEAVQDRPELVGLRRTGVRLAPHVAVVDVRLDPLIDAVAGVVFPSGLLCFLLTSTLFFSVLVERQRERIERSGAGLAACLAMCHGIT